MISLAFFLGLFRKAGKNETRVLHFAVEEVLNTSLLCFAGGFLEREDLEREQGQRLSTEAVVVVLVAENISVEGEDKAIVALPCSKKKCTVNFQ